jgi:uncharacterized Zn finger protein
MQDQRLKVNVSLDKTVGIKCESCGNETFQEALMLRKVSKFLTGQAQDGVLPIPTFVCTKCGHVNQEFYPKELLKNDNE